MTKELKDRLKELQLEQIKKRLLAKNKQEADVVLLSLQLQLARISSSTGRK